MPRRRDRRRGGIRSTDVRHDGIGGGITAGTAESDPATDAVADIYTVLAASSTIGGADEYIATTAVNRAYNLLTVVYP